MKNRNFAMVLLVSLCALGAGCTSEVVSKHAEPGSTVSFALGYEGQYLLGYGGTKPANAKGYFDDQRGQVRAEFLLDGCPASIYDGQAACKLNLRAIFAASAHAASDAAIKNTIFNDYGTWEGLGLTELTVLLNIPKTLSDGTTPFPTGMGSVRLLSGKRNPADPSEVIYTTVATSGSWWLTVIPGSGEKSADGVNWSDVNGSRMSIVPNPRVRFSNYDGSATNPLPAAIHGEISFPSDRVSIESVYVDGINQVDNMVMWNAINQGGGSGLLTFDFVQPTDDRGTVKRLRDEAIAVVFKLKNATDVNVAPAVTPSDFIVDTAATHLYEYDGSEITATGLQAIDIL